MSAPRAGSARRRPSRAGSCGTGTRNRATANARPRSQLSTNTGAGSSRPGPPSPTERSHLTGNAGRCGGHRSLPPATPRCVSRSRAVAQPLPPEMGRLSEKLEALASVVAGRGFLALSPIFEKVVWEGSFPLLSEAIIK